MFETFREITVAVQKLIMRDSTILKWHVGTTEAL